MRPLQGDLRQRLHRAGGAEHLRAAIAEHAFDHLYQYTVNPVGWTDPFGLKACNLVRYKKDKVTPQAGSYTTGINRAWAAEKKLVQRTGQGTVEWTEGQISELLSSGKVKGFTGHHINNAASAPTWQGDPRNIVFLSNGPNGGNHLNSLQGHRGNWQNPTDGRLIDRNEMIRQSENQKGMKC